MSGITPICTCDNDVAPLPFNPPGLQQIAYRAGTFRDFRRQLLTPLVPAQPGSPPIEYALTAWRAAVNADPSVGDLGVMLVEWWAYLADILTFYNERIANEDYLATTQLPESAARLVSILGYRPRPAIGATGTLAALVTPGKSATLPIGLQFQSKPGPGKPPQIFELSAATIIGAPDGVAANPSPPNLLSATADGTYTVLLQGAVTSVSAGQVLLLGPRDDTAAPTLATLAAPPAVAAATGGKQTTLTLSFPDGSPPVLEAANARLQRATQSVALWTANGTGAIGPSYVIDATYKVIQLAGAARQIRPGDWVVFTWPGLLPQLVQVNSTLDVLGDISSAGSPTGVSSGTPTNPPVPIPVLHTQLTLSTALNISPPSQATIGAVRVLFGWVDVGTLVDQPPAAWDGSNSSLAAGQRGVFADGSSLPVIVADSTGAGVLATATSSGDANVSIALQPPATAPLSPALEPPLNVLYNLLPVTRGKTIANEILGSGDATIAGQSFTLAQSPVTYLTTGATYASTIALTVNGVLWTEVASFYGQAATAQVFVTSEDDQNNTLIAFGDGVNGARLPTGTNNIVASYRIGGGAASPAAGTLTVIAQSYPGLRSILNPIAVSGGSDPDPPALLQTDAPRSVLTFGRAVSIFDYQAIAARAGGVIAASAIWAWDATRGRAAICVYVAGDDNVVGSVSAILAGAGDPNRPVSVIAATAITVRLSLTLIITPGMDQNAIGAAVTAALADPAAGLFAPAALGIGAVVFDSQIEATVLGVGGVVAITSSTFDTGGAIDPGPVHATGAGAYYVLTAQNVKISSGPNPNG